MYIYQVCSKYFRPFSSWDFPRFLCICCFAGVKYHLKPFRFVQNISIHFHPRISWSSIYLLHHMDVPLLMMFAVVPLYWSAREGYYFHRTDNWRTAKYQRFMIETIFECDLLLSCHKLTRREQWVMIHGAIQGDTWDRIPHFSHFIIFHPFLCNMNY